MANWSRDTNQKRSEALKGRKQTHEHIAKRVAARKANRAMWIRDGREVCAYTSYRGHPTLCFVDEQIDPEYSSAWRYADDLTKTPQDLDGTGVERPCAACHLTATPNGPDACLGWLPGVTSACCGHGGVDIPYVTLDDGTLLRGEPAVAYMVEHATHPLP